MALRFLIVRLDAYVLVVSNKMRLQHIDVVSCNVGRELWAVAMAADSGRVAPACQRPHVAKNQLPGGIGVDRFGNPISVTRTADATMRSAA